MVRERTKIDCVPTAHFRISDELLERAQRAADADRRSLSNWLGLVVERALEEMPDEPDAARPSQARTSRES